MKLQMNNFSLVLRVTVIKVTNVIVYKTNLIYL